MKKLLLSLLLIASSTVVFAQLPSIGVKGGVNFATISGSGTENQTVAGTNNIANSGSIKSFNIGVFMDVKMGHLSLQPGVNFTGKGGTFNGVTGQLPNGSVSAVDNKYNLYYVQVPVNVLYHVPFAVGEFYLGAGPYVGLGVYGKHKQSADNNANGTHTYFSSDDKIKFGDTEDIKPYDLGGSAIAGITLKGGLLLNLNYDLGLSNILPDADGRNFKTRTFGISVGFVY
ncbi:porin family protein [Mucilaginibacter flavus]|uniref:porin family protein n=1 Tax=Mucilaginibacter flavus TaxID=931504 RepID=UPI0025B369CE|nr:porin family protein [Mucilaginibacter flavus]MDN3579863.1 porin family protein [Mucilaginibacter flavus]